MQEHRFILLAVVTGASILWPCVSWADSFPSWAFPGANLQKQSGSAGGDAGKTFGVPGSSRRFTEDKLQDPYDAPDWFPDAHPPAPAVVLKGRPGAVAACGYCHLPDGSGRPENASLSGLPEDYIRRQVAAFRAGTRRSAAPDYTPGASMTKVAVAATDQEVAAAARYFAALAAPHHIRVVEADRIGGSEAKAFLLRAVPGKGEALGDRIVEGPSDFERFERRDPRLIYTAYVPKGSLKRGEALARTGGSGVTVACNTCHGPDLRGGAEAAGPPLAGRSPSYIFRQLYGFSVGARGGAASAPMQRVVANLTQKDMIALAAYVGRLKP